MSVRKVLLILCFFLIFLSSFVYRLKGLTTQAPFWVDEFSSGVQARSYAQQGIGAYFSDYPKFERNNVLTHLIIASSFKIFGESEHSARVPIAFIGGLVPIAVFILARKLHSTSVALSAMLMTAFLYIEILWSVQARGYVLQQLLVLLTLWLYFHVVMAAKFRWSWLIAFLICIVLGVLTHNFFILLLVSLAVHFVAIRRNIITHSRTRLTLFALFILLITAILYLIGAFAAGWSYIFSSMFGANNLWYYHSFLWGQFPLICFLGLVGLSIGLLQKPKVYSVIIMYLLIHLLFITFGFGHYLSKYLLPIFPLLIIGTAISLYQLAIALTLALKIQIGRISWLKKKHWSLIQRSLTPGTLTICLAIFIVVNGHQFVVKPKLYYSLNTNFREIANIDYNQVYGVIKQTISTSSSPVLIIETWPDRANWYLGNTYPFIAMFRWQDEGGVTSGHAKVTPFELNPDGSKFLPWRPGTGFIGKAADLELATQKYKKGFIWIDDATLPADVIEYAQTHLKKELYLDHYPLDDNPYSIWPGTLYSWGVDS